MDWARPDIDEGPPVEGETANEYVLRLSAEKTRVVAEKARGALVLGADTTVLLDGDVLGKPADAGDAESMLRRLRGRIHTVLTGITIVDARSGDALSASRATDVSIRSYSDAELREYVASGEPLDKAGAYAVQDGRFRPAEEVLGCYLNAVGLPLCEVASLLERFDVRARLVPGWQLPRECTGCPLEETAS